MLFKDRREAAMELLPFLEKYKNDDGVILAVPRGGVPLGYYISKKYNFTLELLLTKKIGHPLNQEFAIGAVGLEDEFVEDYPGISGSYIENETKKIRENLKERYKQFMGDRPPVDLENKTVIVVDDGVATGNTLLAAIKIIRQKNPKKIVAVVPVAPTETANKIGKQADDLICLYTLKGFISVGRYYHDFSEVSDEKVIQLLREANHIENAA